MQWALDVFAHAEKVQIPFFMVSTSYKVSKSIFILLAPIRSMNLTPIATTEIKKEIG
jgi:hypothetical protein